jgi:hypothetical protein
MNYRKRGRFTFTTGKTTLKGFKHSPLYLRTGKKIIKIQFRGVRGRLIGTILVKIDKPPHK